MLCIIHHTTHPKSQYRQDSRVRDCGGVNPLLALSLGSRAGRINAGKLPSTLKLTQLVGFQIYFPVLSM
jgi:hypothetical protein